MTEIREYLTEALNKLDEESPAVAQIRAIRAACRRFMDEPYPDAPLLERRWGHPEGYGFLIALGELRSTIGTHLAFLAAQYGIDVDGGLATVLPIADED